MKKYFVTGLVTLLPLTVTIWIVHFVVTFLTDPFIDMMSVWTNRLPIASPQLVKTISQILILLTLLIVIWFLGFVGTKFFFNQALRLGDRILIRIPLVNKVYKTAKEIVKALLGSKEQSFKQVVLLTFPYPGCYCIGLISHQAPKTCSEAENKTLVSVFIPTTPNPATGFLVMAPVEDLVYLDMKTEDAIKYVVSCAVIQPEGKKK